VTVNVTLVVWAGIVIRPEGLKTKSDEQLVAVTSANDVGLATYKLIVTLIAEPIDFTTKGFTLI
jgi:hypothetical protein